MSPLFSSTKKELTLILDVQSSVIRGSLVLLDNIGSHPHVMFTYNANVPWKPHTDVAYLVKTTLKAIDETINAIRRNLRLRHTKPCDLPKRIRSVHFVLSSPWIVSDAKILLSEFSKNQEVSKDQILKMIADERSKLAKEDDKEIQVIEQKIFDVRLNGYSIKDWEGKSAKKLEVSYTVSVAGTRMIEKLKNLCNHDIHGCEVSFHSSLLLQVIGFGIVMPHVESYVLVHVHGELTEFAIVQNQLCEFFGSYPIGVKTMVRNIANVSKIDQQAADSLLTLYIGGHLDKEYGHDQTDMITTISKDWTEEMKKLLKNHAEIGTLPQSMVVSAWSHDDLFIKVLRDEYPGARIGLIEIDEILPFVSYDDLSERRRLTGLYALAIHSMSKK
ncbi:MAG: hypothetical protein WC648_00915 [Candidatus Paceibacterota bacterium]|jgi:hypothetical protein